MKLVRFYVELLAIWGFVRQCADKEIYNSIGYVLSSKKKLYFVREEMEEIFSGFNQVWLEKYNDIHKSTQLETIIKCQNQRQAEFFVSFYNESIQPIVNGGEAAHAKAKEEFQAFMEKKEGYILNQLEYFAMSFLAIGDPNIVYSSIHPSFLEIVRFYYIKIAQYNSRYDERYHINIQILYNKWNRRSIRLAKKNERQRKIMLRKLKH